MCRAAMLHGAGLEVLLGADQVRFGEPRAEVPIDVAHLHESKGVQVIPRRERLDAAKARVIETSGQHHVPVQPAAARVRLITVGERAPAFPASP